MKTYSIRLQGPLAKGKEISGPLLAELLTIVTNGLRKSARLRVDGYSTSKGTAPSWLDDVATFKWTGAIREGSQIMDFSSPSLAEAAPKYFAQMDFVDDLDTSKTSFDFFEEAIEDATEGRKDRDSYDDGLLSEIVAFEDLFHHGVNKIEIQNGRRPVTIVHERLETVRKLRRETPQPQRVMVAGQLNTVSYNERAFVLLLPDGTRIKGSADAIGPEQLKKFLGKPSVLHGNAVFRPSGTVLRIEADRIEAPQKNDIEVFGREPSPLRGRAAESRTIDQAQGPRSGINAVFGKWPGDETEDELIEYLERLSS